MNRSIPWLIASAATAAAGLAVAQGIDARSAAYIAGNCASCHGTHGHGSGAMPSLAGLRKPQLIEAMQLFRDGKREATLMHQIAKGYTDAQIEALAEHFARLPAAR